jgi:hypothetical protein
MVIDFTVPRRSQGLVASLDADRFALDADGGADLDGGAGDDSQSSNEDASIDHDSEAADAGDDESTREAAGDEGGDHEDDDEDDDERYAHLPADQRVKKLSAALKRNRRRLAERTANHMRVKDLEARGITLDDLLVGFQNYRQFERTLQSNPRLRALLNGGDGDAEERTARGRGDRRTAAADDFQFDDSPEALGFDPKASQANKTLAASMRETARLRHELDRLTSRLDPDKLVQRVDGIERGLTQSQRASIERSWDLAIEAALPHIKEKGVRTLFRDSMISARDRVGGKRDPQEIVNHYLKELGVNPQQAAKASTAAAAASRIRHGAAERVTQLQRQPGRQGTTAPARQGKETLAQVHRRVRTAGGPQVR